MNRFDLSQLSESEKSALARDLLTSAASQEDRSPLPIEQIDEIRRRAAAIDSGQAQCVPWEKTLSDLLAKRGA